MQNTTEHSLKPEISQLLERHGIKPTTQRMQIAEILFDKPQHISADALMDQLREFEQRVSKATVYNTLGLFAEKGVITPIAINPDRIIYDTNTKPHFHFYNNDTSELIDIDSSMIEIKEIPTLPSGTKLDSMDVVLNIKNQRVA